MAFLSKFDCCSREKRGLVLLKFLVVRVSRKSVFSDALEYGCLSGATNVMLLEPCLRVVSLYAYKRGREISE